MFIIRTAVWLGIVVAVMPGDPEQQKRLADTARNGIAQVSTLCDRHQVACQHASTAWGAFKVKAEVAGRMAFDLAMERMAERPKAPSTSPSAVSPDAPAMGASGRRHSTQQGTLRDDDLAPRWRGDQARGRS